MMDQLVVSPCCNPLFMVEQAFSAYRQIGYRQFEAFTNWTSSQFHYTQQPAFYLEKMKRYDMKVTSLHLPPVDADNKEETIADAVVAAEFAQAIGAEAVLFKANSRESYIACAPIFLDAIAHLSVTPVLQNHIRSPIETLEDYRKVIAGIGDSRMKSLLEVGQFHSVGVSWQQGCDLLGDSIALVHVKDQIGAQSVAFGKGEIDLPGLFRHMKNSGYGGKYVVELEVADRENTLQYLADALEYFQNMNL